MRFGFKNATTIITRFEVQYYYKNITIVRKRENNNSFLVPDGHAAVL